MLILNYYYFYYWTYATEKSSHTQLWRHEMDWIFCDFINESCGIKNLQI